MRRTETMPCGCSIQVDDDSEIEAIALCGEEAVTKALADAQRRLAVDHELHYIKIPGVLVFKITKAGADLVYLPLQIKHGGTPK